MHPEADVLLPRRARLCRAPGHACVHATMSRTGHHIKRSTIEGSYCMHALSRLAWRRRTVKQQSSFCDALGYSNAAFVSANTAAEPGAAGSGPHRRRYIRTGRCCLSRFCSSSTRPPVAQAATSSNMMASGRNSFRHCRVFRRACEALATLWPLAAKYLRRTDSCNLVALGM